MEIFNPVSVIIILLAVVPILWGIFMPFSGNRIRYSLGSLLDNIEFLAAVIIASYIVRRTFFNNEGTIYKKLYLLVPLDFRSLLEGQTMLTYLLATPIAMVLVLIILRLFTNPIYKRMVVPFSLRFNSWLQARHDWVKRLMGTLWQLPKAIYLPLIFVLAIHFSSYLLYIPALSNWVNQSKVYSTVYDNTVQPLINSDLARKFPVLANDTIRGLFSRSVPAVAEAEKKENSKPWDVKIIKYFNGITMEEAVKSNTEIDKFAVKLTAKDKSDKSKAYAIYKWISANIRYDYPKAENILKNPLKYKSGTINTFETKKGICLDYSALYVAMSRAVGLKTRIISGQGYSGYTWGDHAWNQVYLKDEKYWVNVDATFGSSGINYFDRPNFNADHRNPIIQGEW